MPGTHGSTSKSGVLAVSLPGSQPSPTNLERPRPAEGTVLEAAVRRARDELRAGEVIVAGFDNKLSADPQPGEEPEAAAHDGLGA
ncbi:hypothetical protein [Actinomadura sp. NTSP31]|uniref:hypothetical protein n=1 Tax=Actinomadura sp. NTSP31 TaxID=1735447 RepID=UPI0035BF783A